MSATKFPTLPQGRLAAVRRLFCVLALISVTACDRSKTPDWDQPGGSTPAKPAAAVEAPKPASTPAPAIEKPAPPPPVAPVVETPDPATIKEEPSTAGLRFIAYNLQNWLTMDRYVDRKSLKGAPKPDKEKEAVVAIIARHTPDVLGLCEIGTAEDLADVQQRLKAAGLDLPHLHYTGGSDPVRHLGLLSRFPITATGTPAETEYKIQGKVYAINRGILDVMIDARGEPYHFVGVHLKSKRDVEDGDQEEMRRAEARLLRKHVDGILEKNPEERLIVYGDFNDTRASNSGKEIFGSFNDPKYLTAIPFSDTAGTHWTHFWSLHDVYSRIDFVTVSKILKPETDFQGSRILDDPEWKDASDHRAILTIFR